MDFERIEEMHELTAGLDYEEYHERMSAEDKQKPHSELLARRFHESYERLAPSFGYETRRESAVPWEDVPEANRALMIATVEEACSDLVEQVEFHKAAAAQNRDAYARLSEQLEALRAAADFALPVLQEYSLGADDAGWQTAASQMHEAHEVLARALSNPASVPYPARFGSSLYDHDPAKRPT